jgi:hypothetical protein
LFLSDVMVMMQRGVPLGWNGWALTQFLVVANRWPRPDCFSALRLPTHTFTVATVALILLPQVDDRARDRDCGELVRDTQLLWNPTLRWRQTMTMKLAAPAADDRCRLLGRLSPWTR